MYSHIWNKYLPIIRILMKRSATGDQVLDLNRIDFERAGSGRKAGYKFTIEFINGKVSNMISSNDLAQALATVLMEDEVIRQLLQQNNYEIGLTTKFKLNIKNNSIQPVAKPEEALLHA